MEGIMEGIKIHFQKSYNKEYLPFIHLPHGVFKNPDRSTTKQLDRIPDEHKIKGVV